MKSFTIDDIVQIMGLKTSKRKTGESYNACCPFCGDTHYHLNINRRKNLWRCNRCGRGGGVFQLFLQEDRDFSREEISNARKKILSLLQGDGCVNFVQTKPQTTAPQARKSYDNHLHNVYSRLLACKPLKLTDTHKSLLEERGLSEMAIMRNGYASFLPNTKQLSPAYVKKLTRVYESLNETYGLSCEEFVFGCGIAKGTCGKEYDPDELFTGVPGFFKVKDVWCFKSVPGILIPVRNVKGEIVSFQTRRTDGKAPKYMTLSTTGLPCGTKGSVRIHFPLKTRSENMKEASVFLTEGTLKADVAAELSSHKIFMGIMGVNSIKPLDGVLENLKRNGVEKIHIALDMDRLTNRNVAKGVKKIKEVISEHKIELSEVFWGADDAEQKKTEYLDFATQNDVAINFSELNKIGNVYKAVKYLALQFANAGLDYDTHWSETSKGIDDFLLSQKKQQN